MANKKVLTVPVNKKRFMEVVNSKGYSIRKLGEAYEDIGRTEKTIRRCLENRAMPPELLDRIARFLNVHPDYLSGVYDSEADKIEDRYLRTLFRSRICPENYPYLLKARSDLDYTKYFEDTLTMNNITMEQFRTLEPIQRVLFRQELAVAILKIVAKYFSHDSFNNDLSEELAYYESFADDFDPFSYFAQLEGVGLSECDIHFDDKDDRVVEEFERKINKKYGSDDAGEFKQKYIGKLPSKNREKSI